MLGQSDGYFFKFSIEDTVQALNQYLQKYTFAVYRVDILSIDPWECFVVQPKAFFALYMFNVIPEF